MVSNDANTVKRNEEIAFQRVLLLLESYTYGITLFGPGNRYASTHNSPTVKINIRQRRNK